MKYFLEIPAIPPGKDFARDTFWGRYVQRFARKRAMGWHIREADYDWFDREETKARLSGTEFPPAPIFQNVFSPVPQPNDGRDERPGRIPRTGKD